MYPLHLLTGHFEAHRDPEKAHFMSKYMKNRFPFYGIQADERRAIGRTFLQEAGLPDPGDRFDIIKELWNKEEREYQLFGMEMLTRVKKFTRPGDIRMYSWMITHKSWWDTVDYIAATLVGHYGREFPERIPGIMAEWMGSGHLWLKRSTLIFQLKYKQKTDTELLARHIHALKDEKDFFIRKAIGWALREYSKTDPAWVRDFVKAVPLPSLSRKEALKYMIRKSLMDE